MTIELSHRLFIDGSSYYTGCAWPTVCGIGMTPREALEDAIEMAIQQAGGNEVGGVDDRHEEILATIGAYDNDEPDEPGELAEIEGWDEGGSEVYWHCEIEIGGLE